MGFTVRALMADILDHANARACGHAARYLRRLRELAATGEPLDPPAAHGAFEQQLNATRPRNVAFRAQVARVGDAGSTNDPLDVQHDSMTSDRGADRKSTRLN